MISFLKQHYVFIVLMFIILISVQIRAFGFFNLDGSTRWEYLRNIDSYYFLKYTSLVYHGQSFDQTIMSPYGGWFISSQPLYPILAAGAYGLFAANITIEYFMAWLPVIIASLVVFPAYFIGKFLWDKKAGLFSALFVTLGSAFVSRSLGGDPDSDAIVMLMFILSMLMVVLMIKCIDKGKFISSKNISIGVISGIVFSLFAYTWSGFWFPFVILMGYIFIRFLFDVLANFKTGLKSIKISFKGIAPLVAVFLIAWCVFAILTFPLGSGYALSPITTPLGAGEHKSDTLMGGMFPNVAVSIAELQGYGNVQMSLLQANGNFNGLLMLFSPLMLAIACLVFLLTSIYKKKNYVDTFLLMFVWFLLFVVAGTVAVRFGMFLAPMYGIASAIILSVLIDVAKTKGRKFLYGAVIFVMFVISFYYVMPAADISYQMGPILNDNWWAALNWIKGNTAECAVIATYWDPGHFITGIANRSVIFDGTSQNALFERHINNSLITPSANVGIISYDNNIIQTYTASGENITTARIKDVTISMLTANETLSADMLLQYRKPGCNETYFLATSDLIGKSTWWTYFATWDPRKEGAFPAKGFVYNYNVLSLASTKYMSQFNMTGLYYGINQDIDVILCAQGNEVIPCMNDSFAMMRVGYQFGKLPGKVIPADSQWGSILYIPHELENSIFTRLFFFNGDGLERFDFIKEWGNEVKLFRVKV